MSPDPELEPRSRALKALLGVRDLVLNGEIAPGERLSEIALAARLDVSRTPLRAALQRLEQEGLIEPIPSGGFAVRRFSRDDVNDAIELRGVLEGTAARLAAERGAAPARLRTMRAVVAEMDLITAGRPEDLPFERYEQLNAAFHATLAEMSGSEIVRRQIERILALPFASPSAFINQQVAIPAFLQSLIIGQSQHKIILAAIENREGSRAEAMAREHARLARANLDFVLDGEAGLKKRLPALALVSG